MDLVKRQKSWESTLIRYIGWNKRAKDARLDLDPKTQTPDTAMSLTEEAQKIRQQNKDLAKGYLKHRGIPWKYEDLAEKMRIIAAEDECNDTYGSCRMCQALTLKYPDNDKNTFYLPRHKLPFPKLEVSRSDSLDLFI